MYIQNQPTFATNIKKNNTPKFYKLYKTRSHFKAKIESKSRWKQKIEVKDRVHIP